VLGEVTVDSRVAGITIISPARRHEKVHDMQAKANLAGPRLLVEERAPLDATDVTFLANPSLEGVGVDLDPVLGFLNGDICRLLGSFRREQRNQQTAPDQGDCGKEIPASRHLFSPPRVARIPLID
jgi:hypothetical protein